MRDDGSALVQFQCTEHELAVDWSVTVSVVEVRRLVSRLVNDAVSLGLGQDSKRVAPE
ncbi:hypothetical protein [Streptomyces sp. NPDC057675]|uniref:hypothetical protein n=1 Tax=Streptomyces sp. NPDC057675 TaxID=3346204 RepID=UPI0036AB8687